MRAICHWLLGKFGSFMITRSSTLKSLRSFSHFWRFCKKGKYSLRNLRQNVLAKSCTCFHCRRIEAVWSLKIPGGSPFAGRTMSRSLGVKARWSLTSSDAADRGRAFTIASHSTTKEWKTSSDKSCSRRTCRRCDRTMRQIRSVAPAWWEAFGGRKTNSVPFCWKRRSRSAAFHWRIASESSFSAPFRLVPWSTRVSSTRIRIY